MNKFLQLLFICLLSFQTAFTQNRTCATMDRLDIIKQDEPNAEQRMMQIEDFTNNIIQNNYQFRSSSIITIPVVVHVVWKQNSQNISVAQIQSQIDVLNEDFRRLNLDANNVWGQAADTEIEFCLATIDPSGNSTDGITRRKTNKQSFSYTNDGVKHQNSGGINAWPTDQYLNMWVCNLGNSLLGYAQFPGSGSADEDGVVMGYQYFGRAPENPFNSNFNLGRTATHEVGHWLNLRHIWGDGGCSVDDYVSDTPLSDAANYGCAISHVSCGTNDMVQNYMDYSDDDCMNLFTSGQKDRMLALFAPGGARASLLSSNGCGGSNPPTASCTDGIQNGNETGIDCGGSCSPCAPTASCTDGIQNGNETGVDCGGSCSPCAPNGACDAPTNLYSQSRKGGKEARLTWDDAQGAISYEVRIRQVGAASWNSTTSSTTQVTATGLSKNSDYEWEVRSICSGSNSVWTSSQFVAGQSGRYLDAILSVYPNPANDYVNIEFGGEWSNTNIYITDIAGKSVYQLLNFNPNEFGYLEIDANFFPTGIFFIHVENPLDGTRKVEKLIISRL